MSHQFRELPLTEAVEETRKRLYGDLTITAGLEKMAQRAGVSMRTMRDWRNGRTGVGWQHVKALQALVRDASIAIEPASMVRGTGTRKRGRK